MVFSKDTPGLLGCSVFRTALFVEDNSYFMTDLLDMFILSRCNIAILQVLALMKCQNC